MAPARAWRTRSWRPSPRGSRRAQPRHAALPVPVHGARLASPGSSHGRPRRGPRRRGRGVARASRPHAVRRRQVLRWPHDLAGAGRPHRPRSPRTDLPRLPVASRGPAVGSGAGRASCRPCGSRCSSCRARATRWPASTCGCPQSARRRAWVRAHASSCSSMPITRSAPRAHRPHEHTTPGRIGGRAGRLDRDRARSLRRLVRSGADQRAIASHVADGVLRLPDPLVQERQVEVAIGKAGIVL